MRLSGRITGASIDFATGRPTICFEINEKSDFKQMVDDLKDKEKLSIEVKPYREKRSLNANAYAWKLIGEIADAVRASKEEVYLIMLKRYGQSELISVLSNVPIGNYVKYYEEAGESKLNGKMFTHYRVYKGSSEFDKREMSIFIEGVCGEARHLGIQVETPNQLAEMKARWNE